MGLARMSCLIALHISTSVGLADAAPNCRRPLLPGRLSTFTRRNTLGGSAPTKAFQVRLSKDDASLQDVAEMCNRRIARSTALMHALAQAG